MTHTNLNVLLYEHIFNKFLPYIGFMCPMTGMGISKRKTTAHNVIVMRKRDVYTATIIVD